MDDAEIRTLASLEDRHWWYAARRELLRRHAERPNGTRIALDVGAAGGGNTQVLASLGWTAVALEYSEVGAQIAASRGVPTIRADAQLLPIGSHQAALVTAFDVLEHLEDDKAAASEIYRALAPGGQLVVAVPADPDLWSAHDEAVGHLRRYTRQTLGDLVGGAGFVIEDMWSWNVLLRPLVALRRKSSEGSDLTAIPAPVNLALRAVIGVEQVVRPLRSRRGVSLVALCRKPSSN